MTTAAADEGAGGFYVATACPARGAFRAAYCSLVAPNSNDMAVMRAHGVDILSVVLPDDSSLEAGAAHATLVPHPLLPNGGCVLMRARLTEMRVVRLPGASTDALFVTTEKEAGLILRVESGRVVVLRQYDLHDRACRPIEAGILVAVQSAWGTYNAGDVPAAKRTRSQPTGRALAAVHTVQGLIKVLDVGAGSARNERIEELGVIDIAFTAPSSPRDAGVLAVLHATSSGGRGLRAYSFGEAGVQAAVASWRMPELEPDAYALVSIPQPWGGLLVLAEDAIVYTNPGRHAQCALAVRPFRATTWLVLDGGSTSSVCRVLMSSSEGDMYLVVLLSEAVDSGVDDPGFVPRRVTALRCERLGRTPPATCMAYLDSGVLFLGATQAHERLIRLSSTRLADGAFVEDLGKVPALAAANYAGIDGAAVDASLIGAWKDNGERVLAVAAGDGLDGAICTLRRGASFTTSWEALLPSEACALDVFSISDALCVSTAVGTHMLVSAADNHLGLEEDGGEALYKEERSLSIVETTNSLLQVTLNAVRLFVRHAGKLRCAAVWTPPSESTEIICADQKEDVLFVACTNGQVHVLGMDGRECFLPIAVGGICSALCAHPTDPAAVLVSTWRSSVVRVVRFDNEQLDKVLGSANESALTVPNGEVITDISTMQHNGHTFVLAGLGSGAVVYALLSGGDLHQAHAAVGSAPVRFYTGKNGVLALSDRLFSVTVDTSSPDSPTLTFSAVDTPANVRSVALSPIDGSCVLLCADSECDRVISGTLDADARRVHAERLPLGVTTSAITAIPPSAFHASLPAVLAALQTLPNGNSRVVLLGTDSSAPLATYDIPAGERACSISTVSLPSSSLGYSVSGSALAIVVGTATVSGAEPDTEPQTGRILTLAPHASDRSLVLVASVSLPGTVYALAPCVHGAAVTPLLVACVNGATMLLSWRRDDTLHWTVVDTHHGQVVGVRLAVRNDLVAVGDLMRSVTLLRVDRSLSETHSAPRLVEVARDIRSNQWITDVSLLGPVNGPALEEHRARVLCTDTLGNVLVLEAVPDPHFPPGPDPRHSRVVLAASAGFHVGQVVTRIVSLPAISDRAPLHAQHVLSTSNGALLVFGELSLPNYTLLRALQLAILRAGPTAMSSSHVGDFPDWRALATERRETRAPPAAPKAGYGPRGGMRDVIDGDLLADFARWADPRVRSEVAAAAGFAEADMTRALVLVVRLSFAGL